MNVRAADMQPGKVVAFEHRGAPKVGKVAGWGTSGATVLTKSGTAFRVPYRVMTALDVPLVKSHGVIAAVVPGSHITATVGGIQHTAVVESLTGDQLVVKLTTPGYHAEGQNGLLYAHEITSVREHPKAAR